MRNTSASSRRIAILLPIALAAGCSATVAATDGATAADHSVYRAATQRRGLDSAAFSHDSARARLPIQPFRCGAPTGDITAFVAVLDSQVGAALREARKHGFHPQPIRVVPGVDHGPLPEAVFAWCDSLQRIAPGNSLQQHE